MKKQKKKSIIPFTKAQIIDRAMLSENEIKDKRTIPLKNLKKEITSWAKKIVE